MVVIYERSRLEIVKVAVYHIKISIIRINNEKVIKLLWAHSESLGTRSRRRTQQTAKRFGEQ